MTDRERLIELIREAKKHTKNANSDLERNMIFADYLLENGVIVPPCKTEEKVPETLLGYSCIVCGNFVSFGDKYCPTCGEYV